jgi:RimJ/RimL family protein N-acetyltransferase
MKIDLIDGHQIRPFERRDIESIVKYADNPRIAQQLEDRFPNPYHHEDAERWLRHLAAQDPLTHFAIATSSEAIGGIGLNLRNDVYHRTADVGYWLGEPFWGSGLATRAVTSFSGWAFENFDLARLQARVFESNPASCRVLEKAGFSCEGRLVRSVTKQGKTMDQHIYALLRPEHESEETL